MPQPPRGAGRPASGATGRRNLANGRRKLESGRPPRPQGQNMEQLHFDVARLDHRLIWRAFTRASVALHKASFAGRA